MHVTPNAEQSRGGAPPSVRAALSAVFLLAALAAAMIWFVLSGAQEGPACGSATVGPGRAGAPVLTKYVGKPVGAPDRAVVHVRAFLPISTGCQDPTGLYLVKQAEAHPDLIAVEINDMKSDTSRRLMEAAGIHCAAVMIDGSTRFEISETGEKVLLEGPMEPRDVWKALQEELRRKLGDRAPRLPPPPEGPSADLTGARSGT